MDLFYTIMFIIKNGVMDLLQGKKIDFILYMLTIIIILFKEPRSLWNIFSFLLLVPSTQSSVNTVYRMKEEAAPVVRASHLITLTFIPCACGFVRREV